MQACSWLISLICLACLRVVVPNDVTHGFEIQGPKRESATHSLENPQYIREGQRRSTRSSRSFMGFRQSGVAPAPLDSLPHGAGTLEQHQLKYTHMDHHPDHSFGAYETQEPEKIRVTGVRRSSQDSNVIIFPKDKRISQVVLTFRDDISKDSDATLANPTKPVPAVTNGGVLGARTVIITNHHYGLGDMLFDQPGESLSDMIFKAVQPLTVDLNPKGASKSSHTKEIVTRVSHDSEQTDSDTKAESPTCSPKSPTLSATTTLDEFGVSEQDSAVTELALTSTSDSGVNLSGELRDDPYTQPSQISYEEWISRQKGTNSAAMPLKYHNHVPTVPERRSSLGQSTQYSPYSGDDNDIDHYERHSQFVSPIMQPNTPDANPYSGDYSASIPTSTASDPSLVQTTTHPTPPPRPKPSLASIPLQYWRNRNNNSSSQSDESGPSSPPSSNSSVPFSLVSTFSKKKRLPPTLPTADSLPQPPPLIIPTIVLHPDEEDGEPARVLSEMDIEYLSTMPPAPLRPLIPSWEECEEDEYYDQDINEGYDYDDYHQGYEQGYDEEGEGEEECGEIMDDDEDMDARIDINGENGKEVNCSGIVGRLEQPGVNPEVEYDPYALDVPIHLEIDLQGLEQGDVSGYGYI
ncbi:hypothetical protein BGZ96_012559 [Linnemannia gamsii]|uniref:Uncharacterized protein n=1 Tax=Linnemannia gamsii TaxID=64522 RepID=A0ABQ7JQI7_9FUNG|nr:hypothetical protein BGZ96_012559 [Linnemannia gamsii]